MSGSILASTMMSPISATSMPRRSKNRTTCRPAAESTSGAVEGSRNLAYRTRFPETFFGFVFRHLSLDRSTIASVHGVKIQGCARCAHVRCCQEAVGMQMKEVQYCIFITDLKGREASGYRTKQQNPQPIDVF